jgi:ferredoxin, 2Fe-2S
MPKVTFKPINQTLQQTFEAQAGETVLEVAIRNDVPLQHACGGFCACTTCHIEVLSGDSNLSPMEDEEADRLDKATGITLHGRLGCQAKVQGDVTVEIQHVGHGH